MAYRPIVLKSAGYPGVALRGPGIAYLSYRLVDLDVSISVPLLLSSHEVHRNCIPYELNRNIPKTFMLTHVLSSSELRATSSPLRVNVNECSKTWVYKLLHSRSD